MRSRLRRLGRRLAVLLPAVLLLVASPCAAAPAAPELLSADAVAVAVPPRVDGDLSDSVWQATVPLMLAHGLASPGSAPVEGPAQGSVVAPAPPVAATSVQVAWTADSLYLAWRCAEPNPERLRLEVTQDGGPAYLDDAVEAFLDPGRSRTGFCQLVSNARGVRYHTRRASATLNTVWYRTGEGAAPWAVAWRAAARVADGEWTVEMAVPWSAFGGRPSPGDAWGANFCHERYASPELSTWAPLTGETFLVPEQFGQLVFRAPVASSTAALVERPASRRPVALPLIPRPQEVTRQRGFTRLPRPLVLQPESAAAATYLAACAPLVGECRVAAVAAGATQDPGALRIAIDTTLGLPPEGYVLRTRSPMSLRAADPLGVRHGLMTLAQLLEADGPAYRVPRLVVRDWPDCGVRAWHAMSPGVDEEAAYRDWVKALCRLKYNTLILEVDGMMQYRSHPEVAQPKAPAPAQLAAWVDYARSLGFDVIPQLAVFGHFGWVLDRNEWATLAEDPAPDPQWGRWVANVRDPRYYPLVFDLFSEAIEVFRPRTFHIGHDEITFRPIGVHPDLAGVAPDQLLAEEVTRLHDWLAARGVATMMWGDQLLPEHNGGRPYYTARAAAALPRDVIIADWHYDPAPTYPSAASFAQQGFRVLACAWWEALNVVNFASQAAATGLLGFSGSSWWRIGGYRQSPEHQTAFVLGAEASWRRQPPLDELGYQPLRAWQRFADWATPVAATVYLPLDLKRSATHSLSAAVACGGRAAAPGGADLSPVPVGLQWWDGVPFRIAGGPAAVVALAAASDPPGSAAGSVTGIPVGTRARALHFAHVASAPVERPADIYERGPAYPGLLGRYRVGYRDGTCAWVPVRYRQEVTDWNDGLPGASAPSLWTGRTRGGAWAQVSGYRWENPFPDKVIDSIDLISANAALRLVVLAVTAEIR